MSIRKGNEKGGGVEHSLYGHYGTTEGIITSEDILLIPDILEHGNREPVKKDGTQCYEYTLKTKDGTTFTVFTEFKDGRENFSDFYSNRKASLSLASTHSEEARSFDNNASGAKLQKVSESARENGVKF